MSEIQRVKAARQVKYALRPAGDLENRGVKRLRAGQTLPRGGVQAQRLVQRLLAPGEVLPEQTARGFELLGR